MQPKEVPTNKTQVATYLADYFYIRLTWLCHKYGKSNSGICREAIEALIREAEERGDFNDMPDDWEQNNK